MPYRTLLPLHCNDDDLYQNNNKVLEDEKKVMWAGLRNHELQAWYVTCVRGKVIASVVCHLSPKSIQAVFFLQHIHTEHKIRFQKCVDKMVEHKGVCSDILKFCTAMVNIQAL